MGLFNFFNKDPNEKIINQINDYLTSTDSFLYFSKDDDKKLIEYKRFETELLAAAIHKVILEKKFRTSLSDNDQQSIKNIYFKNTSHFYNSYIKSGKLKLSILNSNNVDESRWILEVFVKFNKYQEDIISLLKSKKTHWEENWDEPEYDEEFGIIITGQKIYHNFINNIFLSKIVNNPEEIPYIQTIEVWSLPEEDIIYLQKFVDKVYNIVMTLSK